MTVQRDLKVVLDFLVCNCVNSNVNSQLTVDAILLFGQPGAPVAARHAANQYHFNAKTAPIIICGGVSASGKLPPGGFGSDGTYYKSLVRAEGVPDEDIVLEGESSNTLENVQNAVRILQARRARSVLFVTVPPHILRCWLTLQKHCPDIEFLPSTYSPSDRWYNEEDGAVRILGELQRIMLYGEKGDIKTVEIPERVMVAYNRCLEAYRIDASKPIAWTEGHLCLD